MDLLSKDRLNILYHDLRSNWGIISWATEMLDKVDLLQEDYQVYEEMLIRNIVNIETVLDQLKGYFPQITFFTTISSLMNELRSQKTIHTITRLEALLVELYQSINELQKL